MLRHGQQNAQSATPKLSRANYSPPQFCCHELRGMYHSSCMRMRNTDMQFRSLGSTIYTLSLVVMNWGFFSLAYCTPFKYNIPVILLYFILFYFIELNSFVYSSHSKLATWYGRVMCHGHHMPGACTGTKCGNLNVCHIFATFFICIFILYIFIITCEGVDGTWRSHNIAQSHKDFLYHDMGEN